MKKLYLFIGILTFLPVFLFSQTSIPNTTAITQNFDAMAATTTLPTNWKMHASTASPTYTAASSTVTQQASSGSPATGGTYNFGSSASERAVGAMTSGGFASPNSLIGYFRNTNSNNLTQLSVNYAAERYRINTAAASVQFFYSLNGSTWVAVSAGDIATSSFPTGTSAYNFTTGTKVSLTGIVISGLNIAQNADIYLRWNINTTGGNSQGIAIDDISVTGTFVAATPVITPSPTTLSGLTYILGAGPSAAASFTVSASNLTSGGGTLTFSESTDYEVSIINATSGFGASATLTYTGTGSLTSNTVWVRLKSGRAVATYNGQTIGISGGGTTSSVTVEGSVTTPPSNTISTTAASYGPFCNATTNNISVAFTSTGSYTGNFFVQISNNVGLFPGNSTANLISLGSATSPISATIPAAQTAGTGYRVRVVNETPATQSGNDNGTNFTVTAAVIPIVTSNVATIITTTTATLNGNFGTAGVCPATTEKGFVYSQTATNADPIVSGTGVTTTPVAGVTTGVFNLPLTSLATGTGYSFKAYVFNGTTYTYGAVQTFSTLLPADHLTFVGVPATGNVGANLTSFTVEARRPDNSVDNVFTGNITISKATGAGVLSGTLTVAAVAGVATFSTAQFDAADTYTISAASGSLTGATSGNIVVSLTPSTIYLHNFNDGPTTKPYLINPTSTTPSGVFNLNLSNSSWTTSAVGNFTNLAGNTGSSLSNTVSGTQSFTLTFDINSGFQCSITSFNMWMRTSGTGPSAWSLSINSIVVGSGTGIQNTSTTIPNTNVSNAVTAQTGSITAILTLTGGTGGTFRLDDFTLSGFVTAATPTVSISNTGTPATGNIQPNSTNVVLSAFNLSPNTSTDFTAVNITKTGTTTTADLNNVRIFYDADGNGLINGAEASVSGAGIALANTMNFTISGQTGFSTSRRYLVVADVLATATLNRTVTTSIAAASDVTTSITNKTGTAIGNLQTIAYVTSATGYFRSAAVNGNWNTAASWESSNDNITYFASTLTPTSSATAINIRNGHNIVINAAGISMTNTTIENGGTVEITTNSSFELSGASSGRNIQLTVKNGGRFLVNSPGASFSSPTGNASGLIETGGKLVAGPLLGGGSAFCDAYLGRNNGIFYFGDAAICEWLCATTTLGSSSPSDLDFFFPDNSTDMPILRISETPAFPYGSSLANVFYAALEIESTKTFRIQGFGSKTFHGGIRGSGTFIQNAESGNITLGNGTNIPEIGGNVTLNVLSAGLRLPNGAVVPSGASATILSSSQNNSINRAGGNLTVNGTLDITNLRITNTSSGLVIVNGTLKTSHTGGLFGSGSAIADGGLTINNGSTIEYSSNLDQAITATLNYYNITFSGAGVKTPSSAISVNALGTVKITGSCTVDGTAWNIGTAGAATNFIMDGGRFRIGVGGTQPNMDGTYDISGGIIEYQGTTAKTIRSKSYQNIEVTGNNVGTSSSVISLNNLGTFTIKNGGVFIGTNPNASIVGPTGTQSFTMESNSIFRCAIESGFYGPVAGFGLPSPSVRTDIETINLNAGSTIEYARESGVLPGTASSGNQVITIPVSGGSAIPYQNLVIGGNGTKTAPSATLAIQGNLTKSGTSTFNPNGGLVLLNGSSAQTFAGLPFSQLQLTGSAKTTAGSSSIDSLLKIDASTTLNVSTMDSITIKSTATRTASVAALPSTAVINYLGSGASKGKFVVERYLLNGKKWRLLSVPTNSNQTFRKSWQEDGNTVGTVGSYGFWAVDNNPNAVSRGFDGAGSNSSIKRFNPTSQSWVAVANTNSIQMNTERGYMAFIPGNRDVNSFATVSTSTTLRTKGELYREGNAALQIDIPVGQQTLIGNPFASRIDLRMLNMTNVDLAFIVWDPTLTTGSTYGLGAFNTLAWNGTNYENLLGSAAYGAALSENNFIESGLAFFVRSSVTQGSITFEEINKVVGSSVTSFTAGAAQRLRANLYKAPISGNTAVLMDGVMANFSDTYSNEIDGKDIRKVKTFNENVSWKTSDSSVVIDRRAIIVNKDTLHLDLSGLRVQEYQWEIISDNLDFPGRIGFLIDRYLNTSTPLNMAGTTTVNFNVTNVAGSYAADRFKIVFLQEAAGPLPVTFTTVTANRNTDRSVAVQWKVEQEINIVSYEIERSNNGSNFTAVHNRTATGNNSSSVTYNHTDLTPFSGDNFYRIKATSVGGQVQYSAIVKVGSSNSNPTITVYPNPVKDKTIQVRFEQQGSGRFQLQLIATNGQTVFVKELLLNNFNQMQTLTIPNNVSAGSYQLKIQKPDGSVEITKLWIE
jgi:hypothetical protein